MKRRVMCVSVFLFLLSAMMGCDFTPLCEKDSDCELGRYCPVVGSGVDYCTSDCKTNNHCGEKKECNERGRCVWTVTPD